VPSIAVLPFVNRSRDEEDEYFSDGLADELLNVLTKIRGLRVAARTSSFQFKGKSEDLAVIGRKLNVATLLEGTVRKAGSRVRIAVQLVKVADGFQLWSETYDRTLDDIFAVQDDIAQSVVRELRTTLVGEAADSKASGEVKAEVAAAAKGRGESGEAHRLYLQGRHLIDRVSPEETAKGVEYLGAALRLDPDSALAWAELSRGYDYQAGYGWVPLEEGTRRAREAAERAVALQPDLAEAHAMLARIQMSHDWDWKGAEASYRRALELAPALGEALRGAGSLTHCLGRLDEAIALCRRAVEQDPLSTSCYTALGHALRAAGRLPEAEAAFRQALELAPRRTAARMVLALLLLDQGRPDEALAQAEREEADWARLLALHLIHHAGGRIEQAEQALRELIGTHAGDSAYQIAAAYGARGEADAAFEWLERSYAQRDPGLAFVKCEPIFRSLHGDPRWETLLEKLGLSR
jgi:TolB-like protein/Tfp pilus assembly protein PilF